MFLTFDQVKKKIEREKKKKVESPILVQYLRSIFSYSSSYFVSESVNMGRLNAVEYIDGIKIAAAQWSAIMDEKTCEYCASLDEETIFVDNPLYGLQQPPAHGRCRCVYIYITAEELGVEETWEPPSVDEIARYGLYNIESEDGARMFAEFFGERAVRNALNFAAAEEYDSGMWDVTEVPF